MISVEELLGLAGCASAVVDVDGLGKVRARPLSTVEALEVGRTDDNAERAALVLHYGLVDPAVTREQAVELVAGAPFGQINTITQEILRLSGMTEEAQKSGRAGPAPGGG